MRSRSRTHSGSRQTIAQPLRSISSAKSLWCESMRESFGTTISRRSRAVVAQVGDGAGTGRRNERIDPAPTRGRDEFEIVSRTRIESERTCVAHDEVGRSDPLLQIVREPHHLDLDAAEGACSDL